VEPGRVGGSSANGWGGGGVGRKIGRGGGGAARGGSSLSAEAGATEQRASAIPDIMGSTLNFGADGAGSRCG